jgi:hypothetical protein
MTIEQVIGLMVDLQVFYYLPDLDPNQIIPNFLLTHHLI